MADYAAWWLETGEAPQKAAAMRLGRRLLPVLEEDSPQRKAPKLKGPVLLGAGGRALGQLLAVAGEELGENPPHQPRRLASDVPVGLEQQLIEEFQGDVLGLRQTAVDHNIRLMHRLSRERLFVGTLEAAREKSFAVSPPPGRRSCFTRKSA